MLLVMRKWILFFVVVFIPFEASARFSEMEFVNVVKHSKYAIVAKIEKVENIGCGHIANVQVIDDLKGNAPKFLDVGTIWDHLREGQIYFLKIIEG